MLRPPPRYTPFPYTTLFRSQQEELSDGAKGDVDLEVAVMRLVQVVGVGLLNVVEAIAEPEALEAGSDQRIARLARSEERRVGKEWRSRRWGVSGKGNRVVTW